LVVAGYLDSLGMVDFRINRPLVVVARVILASVSTFALIACYLGFSQPDALPLLGTIALGAFGAIFLGVALFGPPK
jgi:Na+/proline symporter